MFRRFAPYYRHLRLVKLPFAIGLLSGLLYAMASGLGLPLVTNFVLPILFQREKAVAVKPAASAAYPSFIAGVAHWVESLSNSLHASLARLPENQLLLFATLWIPIMFFFRALAGYCNSYFIQYSGLKVLERIRTDIFIRLQQLPISFYHKNRAGDLLARIMNDTEVLKNVVAQASSDLIRQPATLIFALVAVIALAWQDQSILIAFAVMGTVPLCVISIRITGRRLAAKAKRLQRKNGDLSAVLAESLSSPMEIRTYNLQDRQIATFQEKIKNMLRLSMKVVKYRQSISPLIEVVASAGFAFALYAGKSKGMSLEKFTALGAALFMAYEPLKKLGMIHSLFKQGESALDRIEYILHAPDTIPDAKDPLPAPAADRSLRFDHVSFAYGEAPVLHDIDLEVPAGQIVALVGKSGAGKTSFIQLIPRLYDPIAGSVLLDGVDLRNLSKRELRDRIAVMPQNPALFSGTILENIRLGRLTATDEEVREAARLAHAEDFILAQPEGYLTMVGERGTALSGGQRQRVAIARAFLKDAPILILDEATSALDSESEAHIQAALQQLVKGRTTFIIAHRFSTIAVADRILFFADGHIVADGPHQELYRDFEPYRKMYDLQSL